MRRPVVAMVLGGVIASAIGIALGLAIDWFPTIASTQAGEIETLFDVMIIASVPIFVLVMTVVIAAVIQFRMRPGQEDQDGPPIHGNTKLEVIWTVLPAILILGLCAYSYVVLEDIEEAPAAERELKVGVTGEQFAWTFTYPPESTGQERPLTTTDLVLPLGRSVNFDIRAKDVIHDFWVPDFSMKMDAVPGITTHYRVTPDRLGEYPVVCAELCGLGHSVMRSQVRVVSEQDFESWLEEQSAPAAPSGEEAGPGELAAAGKQIFAGSAGCGGCHALADAGTTGQIGPDLDEALPGQSEAKIREDITDPNAEIAKGYADGIMPTTYEQTLAPEELDALVAYLQEATK